MPGEAFIKVGTKASKVAFDAIQRNREEIAAALIRSQDAVAGARDAALKKAGALRDRFFSRFNRKPRSPCGCFAAGTVVLTPNGLVDIETIDIGDFVMARHETTGEIGAYPVEALIRPKDRVIWVLEFLDADGEAETFQTTDDHPWHVTDHAGFIETADLILGMRISTRDGRGMTLMSVTQTERTADTYNLTVTDAHTFFVGEDGAWVHNVDCFDQTITLPNGRQLDVSLDQDDLDHVLKGSKGADGSVTGGHSTNSGNVKIVGDVELGHGGVRRAPVEIDSSLKTNTPGGVSTLFPESWSDSRIVKEASEAVKNGTHYGPNGQLRAVSPSGVIIEYRRAAGKIISFFPASSNFSP